MRKILFCALFAGGFINLTAQNSDNLYEELHLYDGSVYYGYISKQNVLTKEVNITSSMSISTIKSSLISDRVSGKMKVSELAVPVQNWLNSNPAFIEGEGDDATVVVTKISRTKGDDIRNTIIIEDGDIVKYVIANNNAPISVHADSIRAIHYSCRDKNEITGIDEVFETKSGMSYKGQVVDVNWGKDYRLLKEDGRIQVIKVSDISAYSKHSVNTQLDLFEQYPYIETITTKKGIKYSGIISKRVYADKGSDNKSMLFVTTKGKNVEPVELSNVKLIERRRNDDYKPRYSREISGDDFVLCGNNCFAGVLEVKDDVYFVSDADSPHLILSPDSIENLILEVKNDVANKNIYLIPLSKYSYDKKTQKLGFKGTDFMINEIEPIETKFDVSGIITRTYHSPLKGNYVLFRKKDSSVHWFEIK